MEQGGIRDAATKLFRVRRTVFQMLRDRGYLVSHDDLNMSLDQFRDLYGDHPDRSQLSVQTHLVTDETEQIIVFFPSETKVNSQAIQKLVQIMQSNGVYHGILVIQEALTAQAAKFLAEGQLDPYRLEVFLEKELVVNITEHDLVPKHTPLTEEEKATLLKRYKVKDVELPRIKSNDPVARYLGLKKGQVVRIVRKSETAGRYVTYRVCM